MTYDVIQKVNGNTVIVSSWVNNLVGAKQAFHKRCELLYSDAEVTSGVVSIVDDNLDVVEGMKEYITK